MGTGEVLEEVLGPSLAGMAADRMGFDRAALDHARSGQASPAPVALQAA